MYIHIPFCIRKCNYCDFLSFPAGEREQDAYIGALCREIQSFFSEERPLIDSVFIGGGTPSVLKPGLTELLLKTIREQGRLSRDCEITIEANPGTLDEEKARVYRENGVNRVSLGVQSLNDALLKRLGRIHSREDFLRTFELLRRMGFDNINTDLMFGLPEQSQNDWEDTLREILCLRPEHLSFYGLMIEEGTPFYEEWRAGCLQPVSDEGDRRMYWEGIRRLTEAGYVHYEISNAALAGRASRHNLKYWNMEDYVGFGLGAHSFFQGCRFHNTDSFSDYLEENAEVSVRGPEDYSDFYKNTKKDMAEEFIFTGLRMMRGISKADFLDLTGKPIDVIYSREIEKMAEEGMLCEENDRIRLTKKGLDFSNYVMREFLREEEWEDGEKEHGADAEKGNKDGNGN